MMGKATHDSSCHLLRSRPTHQMSISQNSMFLNLLDNKLHSNKWEYGPVQITWFVLLFLFLRKPHIADVTFIKCKKKLIKAFGFI